MTNALILVDYQRDYFPGGAHPLYEPEAAVAVAAEMLATWRTAGQPVIHLQHVAEETDATFMRPGTDGVRIHPAVAPIDGETVVIKHWPNGFLHTSLLDDLRSVSAERVTVVGMMTNMCIDATVRAASDLGFDVTVAADACAASPLRFGGRLVDGESVQAAFLAALDGTYARVLPAVEVTPA